MKKLSRILCLALAVMMAMSLLAISAAAENPHFDKLTLEFVPSKDADVIIAGTANLPELVKAEMAKLGYENVFVGTVEGEPEETSCEAVIEAVKNAGYTTVVLRPLMVVAGDHANNDMAGADDDSWKTMFEAAGFTVNCQISGLGRIADVQALYVAHTKAAIDAIA